MKAWAMGKGRLSGAPASKHSFIRDSPCFPQKRQTYRSRCRGTSTSWDSRDNQRPVRTRTPLQYPVPEPRSRTLPQYTCPSTLLQYTLFQYTCPSTTTPEPLSATSASDSRSGGSVWTSVVSLQGVTDSQTHGGFNWSCWSRSEVKRQNQDVMTEIRPAEPRKFSLDPLTSVWIRLIRGQHTYTCVCVCECVQMQLRSTTYVHVTEGSQDVAFMGRNVLRQETTLESRP